MQTIKAKRTLHLAWFFIFVVGFVASSVWVIADTVSDTESVDVTAIVGGATPPGGGGTGSVIAQVVFSGQSFPGAKLTVLKDGYRYTTLVAQQDGSFRITVNGLANGNYQFAIYAQDKNGVESSPYVANVSITNSPPTSYNNILIPPTISASNTLVTIGQTFMVFGYSVKGGNVLIEVPGRGVVATGIADDNGLYQIPVPSTFNLGIVQLRARAELNGFQSNYSKPLQILVYKGLPGEIPAPPAEYGLCVDYNKDRRVNLIDFSILLYWFAKDSPPARIDCNSDRKIDIKDFSILMYFWTG